MSARRAVSALPFIVFVTGCGAAPEERVDVQRAADSVVDDVTFDSLGMSETVSKNPLDLSANNPFFHDFGTNERVYGSCHQETHGAHRTEGLETFMLPCDTFTKA